MNMWKTLVAAAILVFASLHAGAVIVPQQPNGGEPPLYQIYNGIYGTNFTSNSDPDFLNTQTGLETLTIGSDVASISFDALWRQAFLTDNFGYYTSSNAKITLNMTPVLGPFDNSNPNVGQGPITMDPVTVDATGLSEIGFYDHATLPTDSNVFFNWFSQPFLNDGQAQTQPNEVHVLILSTPFDDSYLVCFEDLPYNYLVDDNAKQQNIGDQDYQDLLVQVTLNPAVVPEPSSLALLGLGLATFGLRRYGKRA